MCIDTYCPLQVYSEFVAWYDIFKFLFIELLCKPEAFSLRTINISLLMFKIKPNLQEVYPGNEHTIFFFGSPASYIADSSIKKYSRAAW